VWVGGHDCVLVLVLVSVIVSSTKGRRPRRSARQYTATRRGEVMYTSQN